jgi:hypothetical protein
MPSIPTLSRILLVVLVASVLIRIAVFAAE